MQLLWKGESMFSNLMNLVDPCTRIHCSYRQLKVNEEPVKLKGLFCLVNLHLPSADSNRRGILIWIIWQNLNFDSFWPKHIFYIHAQHWLATYSTMGPRVRCIYMNTAKVNNKNGSVDDMVGMVVFLVDSPQVLEFLISLEKFQIQAFCSFSALFFFMQNINQSKTTELMSMNLICNLSLINRTQG